VTHRLGLRFEEQDEALEETEPFEVASLDGYAIRQDLVDMALDVLTSVYGPDDPNNRARVERALILGMVDLILRAQTFDHFDLAAFKTKLARAKYRFQGQPQAITPNGFQSYLNSLIASGDLIVPALNSGAGQSAIYGKAFGYAILGREQTRQVYGI